ncbi:MAG: alpha/beta fold hydrolase [Xanthomonadales bacterium]
MTDEHRQRLEAESWLAVIQAYQTCTRRYAQMLEHFGLTIPQFDVMTAVRRLRDDATPKAIADQLLVTKGNVTGLVSRLEARGVLVRRPHSTDGRSFYCELTNDGLALYREARAAAARFVGAQLAPFEDEDLARTREQMRRMREHLETLDPHGIADGMMLREARLFADVTRMTLPLAGALLRPSPVNGGSLVIVLPGFGASDRSTAPMRAWLNRRGFETEGWALGRNLAGLDLRGGIDDVSAGWALQPTVQHNGEFGVPLLADRFARRVRERHGEVGRPISLVGWSLGGYIAREAARELPDIVDRVVTLGSPVVGGPKYTAAADTFRRRGQDLDWIERVVAEREVQPIRQPITAIVSPTDGVVAREAAIDRYSENVTHVEVDAAHLGLAFNPTVWRLVLDALRGDSASGRDA